MKVSKYTYDKLIEGGINGGYDVNGIPTGTQLTEDSTSIPTLKDTMDANGKIGQFAYEGVDFTTTTGKAALKEIQDSPAVKSFDFSAFAGATFPDTFALPTSLEEIGLSAFEGATFQGNLTIPTTVTTVADGSFKNAVGKKLTYDAATKKVGESTFSCSDDTKGFADGIEFGTNAINFVTEISESAFSGVKFAHEFHLPTTLTMIRPRAFSGATFSEKLTFPALAVEFKEEVFKSAKLLKGIDLSPATITMGDGAFNSATIEASFG